MINGYYSLLQYCPDPSRAEVANVGVLLYCPEIKFIDATITSNNDKIKRFFGASDFDPSLLQFAKESIKNRVVNNKDKIETIIDLEKFIKTRVNEVRLTALRSMKVEDPKQELDTLFRELVEEGTVAKTRQGKTFLEVDKILRRPSLKNKILFNCQVKLPILGKEIKIPYGYQNGVRNLIKPLRLSLNNQGVDKILSVVGEGDLLQNHDIEGKKNKFIVILLKAIANKYDNPAYSEKDIEKIFSEYDIRTVKEGKLKEFADEIEETAH